MPWNMTEYTFNVEDWSPPFDPSGSFPHYLRYLLAMGMNGILKFLQCFFTYLRHCKNPFSCITCLQNMKSTSMTIKFVNSIGSGTQDQIRKVKHSITQSEAGGTQSQISKLPTLSKVEWLQKVRPRMTQYQIMRLIFFYPFSPLELKVLIPWGMNGGSNQK